MIDDEATEVPLTLNVQVPLRRSGRGVYELSPPIVSGMVYVDEERPCLVQLQISELAPDPGAADKKEPQSLQLAVQFRTLDHREGVLYHFDATDFLESVVRGYFAHARDDQPIADPPVKR